MKMGGRDLLRFIQMLDKGQPAIYLADQSICIGSGKSSASYLNVANILTAAIESGCEAIHPGYGFLAENGDFAEKVEACGLKTHRTIIEGD